LFFIYPLCIIESIIMQLEKGVHKYKYLMTNLPFLEYKKIRDALNKAK